MLLTLIDAEEAFDWSEPFSRQATDVASMRQVGLTQPIHDRFGVVPTYLVDFPVAAQECGRAPLRELLQDGLCDIGAQLHPWVNPPFLEQVSERNSYAGNLPESQEQRKVARLTEEIEAAFGVRPRIYRAGRYGMGPHTAGILRQLEYQADSSVMPGWNFTRRHGPDFTDMGARPHWIGAEGDLLEIPVSSGTVGHFSGLGGLLGRALDNGWGARTGLTAALARLRLLERIKLTPEGITVAEAKRLVRHMLDRQHKVFVLTYHTPSLEPGNTPYVRDAADLRRFLAWLEEFYGWFLGELGGRCGTWRDVAATMRRAAPVAPAVKPACVAA